MNQQDSRHDANDHSWVSPATWPCLPTTPISLLPAQHSRLRTGQEVQAPMPMPRHRVIDTCPSPGRPHTEHGWGKPGRAIRRVGQRRKTNPPGPPSPESGFDVCPRARRHKDKEGQVWKAPYLNNMLSFFFFICEEN